MFDVDDCPPLLTLSRVNTLLAITSETKTLALPLLFTVRYPLIMQACSDWIPKPTFAYRLYRKSPCDNYSISQSPSLPSYVYISHAELLISIFAVPASSSSFLSGVSLHLLLLICISLLLLHHHHNAIVYEITTF